MKLREVLNVVENGQYVNDKEYREIEKRVKQIKSFFKIKTLYITNEYINIYESLTGIFVCEHQMNEYVSNNEYHHIQIVKE